MITYKKISYGGNTIEFEGQHEIDMLMEIRSCPLMLRVAVAELDDLEQLEDAAKILYDDMCAGCAQVLTQKYVWRETGEDVVWDDLLQEIYGKEMTTDKLLRKLRAKTVKRDMLIRVNKLVWNNIEMEEKGGEK